jgi:hypothetical protein
VEEVVVACFKTTMKKPPLGVIQIWNRPNKLLLLLLLLTAIGLSPGGSSPTPVQTKIKIHKTITTKQLQNIRKHKTTK